MHQFMGIICSMVAVLMIVLFCTAGKSADKWEWRAGDYATQSKYQKTDYVCRHKVRDLGAEMQKQGVPFKVAVGTRCLEPHCWIIYNGEILDPAQLADAPDLYKTEEVMSYDAFLKRFKDSL